MGTDSQRIIINNQRSQCLDPRSVCAERVRVRILTETQMVIAMSTSNTLQDGLKTISAKEVQQNVVTVHAGVKLEMRD